MPLLTNPSPPTGTPPQPVPGLRWGVLGTARIAVEQVIPATRRARGAEVVAIASRSADRARAVAAAQDIPRVHSYQALLADDAVEAVYIPLPNHLHVEWALRALAAGKHVLCEKPIGMNARELKPLLAAARAHPDRCVMEAFMYRCHPRWRAAEGLVRNGGIGLPGAVTTVFSYFNRNPDDIRNRADTGGGALLDIGCYGVSVARLLFGREPSKVLGSIHRDAGFDTDRLSSVLLDFDEGSATVICSTQLAGFQRVTVHGSEGWLQIDQPFNPPADRPTHIVVHRGDTTDELSFPPCNQYTEQVERFALAAARRAEVPVSLEDSAANMRVLDAVLESVRFGEAIPLA
jgi:predicted dehydrogenase